MSASSSDIRVGEPVTFHVEAHDPDDSIDDPVGCGYAAQFGDGDGTKPCHRPPACQARYGPWTPPPARPGQVVQDWTHTYTASGFFTVDFEFNLNDDCGQNPYRSGGSVTMQVTVRP